MNLNVSTSPFWEDNIMHVPIKPPRTIIQTMVQSLEAWVLTSSGSCWQRTSKRCDCWSDPPMTWRGRLGAPTPPPVLGLCAPLASPMLEAVWEQQPWDRSVVERPSGLYGLNPVKASCVSLPSSMQASFKWPSKEVSTQQKLIEILNYQAAS